MNDQTKKVSINRQKKEQVVSELSEKVSRAKGLVFTNYQGLTHKQLEALKKGLKTVDAELVVTKNTLLALALANSEFKVQNAEFKNPTATVFSYSDVIAPLKELAKTIKLLKLPIIKFAILSRETGSRSAGDNQILDSEAVLRLSTLPSREVLLAQLVGGMKAPIYGLHRALLWNLQKLFLTLKAIEVKNLDGRK